MRKEKCEFEQFMAAQEDDAARLEQEQNRPQTVAAAINAYLTDQLKSRDMGDLYQKHGPAIEAERVRRERVAERKTRKDAETAKIFWAGGGSRDESFQANVAVQHFVSSHSELHRLSESENAKIGARLRKWLTGERLECKESNLERGFAYLKASGEITLKTAEESRIEQMSADNYLAESPELHDTRTPPLERAAVEKALLSFPSLRPEFLPTSKNASLMLQWLEETALPPSTGSFVQAFDALKSQGLLELSNAVVSSGSTKLQDHGERQPGYPPTLSKPSFRKLVRDLTADELKQRILDDPGFENALDNLSR